MLSWKYALGTMVIGAVLGFAIAQGLSSQKRKKYYEFSQHTESCPRRRLLLNQLKSPPDCVCFLNVDDQKFEDELMYIQYLKFANF